MKENVSGCFFLNTVYNRQIMASVSVFNSTYNAGYYVQQLFCRHMFLVCRFACLFVDVQKI